MVNKIELIPLSEGNRITVKENEKVIIGRGSSLGVCLIISHINILFNELFEIF